MIRTVATLATVVGALLPLANSSTSAAAAAAPSSRTVQPSQQALHPFGVGEVLEYDMRVALARGKARLEIASLDTVRGRPAVHAKFSVRGGIGLLGLKVDEMYDTWVDVKTISTLRYREDVRDSFYKRKRDYEFFPEMRRFTDGVDTANTVERPVDQASVFYLIRTLDLRVGMDTSLNNYFQLDKNPIRIRVLGRERIKVDAGTYDAFVVQPLIKTQGLFSEGGDARVWITDDDRRIVAQIKARVPGFTLTISLKNYTPAPVNLPVVRP